MRAIAGLLMVGGVACAPMGDPLPTDGPQIEVDGELVPPGWQGADGPCVLDPPAPSQLLVTTTDFATGALTVVDLPDGVVRADVAVASTDAIPFADDDEVVLLHRHRIDRIDVLAADSWELQAQHALSGDAPSVNPHGLAFAADGRAYVTSFAEPWLRVLDLHAPPSSAELARVDLSGFADADGNPEASLAVTCGALVFVTLERLDPSFEPVGTDMLVTIDTARDVALDLDPDTPAADALPLLGTWIRQLRRDPTDPEGRTLLALSTGLERIDTSTGVRRWVVSPETMSDAGLGERFQAQAFDVNEAGDTAYFAAYERDFSQVRLFRVGLDGAEPVVPEPFAEGFDSVERTLELVEDELWYGSTRTGQPGLWHFDTSTEPPAVVEGPISTGLPPYSMAVRP